MKPNYKTFEVRRLAKEDLSVFSSLIRLFNIVFEEAESSISSEANLLRLLSNNHFIALAAIDDTQVVGGLTAYVLPMYYSEFPEIFLYDLAVKPEYQRIGVGKRLIHDLKEYCVKHGVKVFFVLAHEEDEHAIEFYRSTGGKSEKVVNFLYKTTEE